MKEFLEDLEKLLSKHESIAICSSYSNGKVVFIDLDKKQRKITSTHRVVVSASIPMLIKSLGAK